MSRSKKSNPVRVSEASVREPRPPASPAKRHKGLLLAISIVLLLWIAFLIVLAVKF